jgi:ABC-type molybdate transport system substrate-binding protein
MPCGDTARLTRPADAGRRCGTFNTGEWKPMRAIRLLTGVLILVGGIVAADADAAELKLLSPEVMKPALQELAAAYEKESGNKLKIEYAPVETIRKKINDEEEYDVVIMDQKATAALTKAAKVVGGSVKSLAKEKDDVYIASSPMLSEQPVEAQMLIDFLKGPKAAEVYKTKGLQPG